MNTETEIAIEAVKLGNHEYYLKALQFSEGWVKITFKPFSSEDLKQAFYLAGNPEPDEPRVFGAVINELKRQKLIEFHSYRKYKDIKGHGRPSTVWISTEYRLKQQSNRIAPYRDQLSIPL